jgi:hypothetical protein
MQDGQQDMVLQGFTCEMRVTWVRIRAVEMEKVVCKNKNWEDLGGYNLTLWEEVTFF